MLDVFGNKPRRVHPRGGKGFNILQPRDWRGRWITSRGVHTNSEGKKVEGALGSARAYKLYAVDKSRARGIGVSGLKRIRCLMREFLLVGQLSVSMPVLFSLVLVGVLLAVAI